MPLFQSNFAIHSLHVEDARALLGYINELEKENALLGAKKGAGQ